MLKKLPPPKYANLSAIQQDLSAKKISVEALVRHYLHQISATQNLNIYIEVFEEEALKKAIALDKRLSENPTTVGRLAGAVISIKDVICFAQHKVSAASKILENFTSVYTASALQRLLDEDAIIIGRTNCDQFAMGSANDNSFYGATHNALDPDKVPGGSSGGAAVSIQADTCLAALGSDTGGSVRQPAAFCGVVGMKPTYGRISRYGLLAYASSFDQIGTLTHSIDDAALLLEIMSGSDDYDSTASMQPPVKYTDNAANNKLKIAYFDTALNNAAMDDSIRNVTLQFIKQLKTDGHSVEAMPFDLLNYIIPAYYVLTTAEASSNLSRYDGIRYGYRHEDAKNLEEVYTLSRTEGFSAEVKRRIMLGAFVLSSGYYDAYYTKAQKVRRLIQEQTLSILEQYDFILTPASPIPAWNIGEKSDDPVAMYFADIFTVQANMTGLPAICFPIGKDKNGMPIGIQFMANKWQESELFSFAKQYETYKIKNATD